MKGVLAGALALLALQVLVTTSNGTGLSALAALPGAWARKFLDPTIPAISGEGSTPSTSAATSATTPAQAIAALKVPSIF